MSSATRRQCLRALTDELRRLAELLAPLDPSTEGRPSVHRAPASDEPTRNRDTTPLQRLVNSFALTAFERDVLLLAAGAECSRAFGASLARMHARRDQEAPTLGLAVSALPDPDWAVLAPTEPLRYWHLVEIPPNDRLVDAPIRVDRRILHELLGAGGVAEELEGIVTIAEPAEVDFASAGEVAAKLVAAWPSPDERPSRAQTPCVLALVTADRAGARDVVARAAAEVGARAVVVVDGAALPTDRRELQRLSRLVEREALLRGAPILLEGWIEGDDKPRLSAFTSFIDALGGSAEARERGVRTPTLLVSSREQVAPPSRPMSVFDVLPPTRAEQASLLRRSLGARAPADEEIRRIVAQFRLSPSAIHEVARRALTARSKPGARPLWDACRAATRAQIDHLAQRLQGTASFDDLVLPEEKKRTLREIVAHVRHRAQVYEDWGFGPDGAHGLAICALFSGTSGTGKTMAAEVLAGELELDLYRIDLSSVVSKYIGETQKNLRVIFDAAEAGGVVLLFDEADALFGKRSEVKDSHDRYANVEVAYLLQRVETYRGLAILTTNLREAIDTAFTRRIRFVVDFTFPTRESRAQIWARALPPPARREAIDVEALAALDLAGGNIRNVALRGAFLAAEQGQSIQMRHLLDAARAEYEKLGRPMPGGAFS